MTKENIFFFSVRDINPVQPPPPPPVKGAVPLFNPSEIQLERNHALLAEKKSTSRAQRENPFRKAINGRIVNLMCLLSLKVP